MSILKIIPSGFIVASQWAVLEMTYRTQGKKGRWLLIHIDGHLLYSGVGIAIGIAASLPLSVVILQNVHSLFPVSFLPCCPAELRISPCLKAVRNSEIM